MLDMTSSSSGAKYPALQATLWRCGRCDSFVSIHSPRIVTEVLCPACGISMEFCGSFQSILGLQVADA